MSPSLLPAIVSLPLAAPAAPGPATAPGAVPNPGFAQELNQARAAKANPAPSPAATPPASPPTPPKADKGSAKPAAHAEESTSAKALRQWLAQNAAARRSTGQGKSSTTAEAATDGAEAAEKPTAGTRRTAARIDSAEDPAALPASPGQASLEPVDSSVPRGASSALADEPETLAASDPTGTEVPLLAAASAPAFAAPLPAAAATAAATAPASNLAIETPGPGMAGRVGDAVGRAATDIEGASERELPSDDETSSEAVGQDAAQAFANGAGPAALSAADARRASAPVAALGAHHESGPEQHSAELDGERFSAVLARQVEATAPVMPQPAPMPAMPRSDPLAPSPATPAEVPVPTAFGTPEWAQNVGQQISLLAIDGVDNARLHLHPAEMGPITVQITVDGQTAQVHLSVDNAETRQALEQAMPNLASSLRESGLTLTGGGVSEQSRQPSPQPDADSRARTAQAPAGRESPLASGEPAAAARVARLQGVVDLYA